MKIQVLGCCKEYPGFSTTAFLLNNHLLLDAGDMGEVSLRLKSAIFSSPTVISIT